MSWYDDSAWKRWPHILFMGIFQWLQRLLRWTYQCCTDIKKKLLSGKLRSINFQRKIHWRLPNRLGIRFLIFIFRLDSKVGEVHWNTRVDMIFLSILLTTASLFGMVQRQLPPRATYPAISTACLRRMIPSSLFTTTPLHLNYLSL